MSIQLLRDGSGSCTSAWPHGRPGAPPGKPVAGSSAGLTGVMVRVERPQIYYTDVDGLWLLASFGETASFGGLATCSRLLEGEKHLAITGGKFLVGSKNSNASFPQRLRVHHHPVLILHSTAVYLILTITERQQLGWNDT